MMGIFNRLINSVRELKPEVDEIGEVYEVAMSRAAAALLIRYDAEREGDTETVQEQQAILDEQTALLPPDLSLSASLAIRSAHYATTIKIGADGSSKQSR